MDHLKKIAILQKEVDDYRKQVKQLQDDNNKNSNEFNKLVQELNTEQLLKQQAFNKLHEIMNRKDVNKTSEDLRKKEEDFKKLQQELSQEKEKFNQTIAIYQKNILELTLQVSDELSARQRLQMELDSKNSEIERLNIKLQAVSGEIASLNSPDNSDEINIDSVLEGWLSIPLKQNIGRHGWKRQYVVVSSKKIMFYKSENDKQNTDPVIILDLCNVFHVRSVTQGDVISADSKDIPRIFQLLYAGEDDARKPDDQNFYDEQPLTLSHKGHEFFIITYHIPTTCEVCPKPMWNMFRPPPALECKRCRIKIHRDHIEKNDVVPLCKFHYDPSYGNLLLLASTNADQKLWVSRLSMKIQKYGYEAHNANVMCDRKM